MYPAFRNTILPIDHSFLWPHPRSHPIEVNAFIQSLNWMGLYVRTGAFFQMNISEFVPN